MLTLGDLEELCLFLHVRHSLLLCLREVVGFDERPVLERLVRLEVLVVGLVLRGGHWATASRDWAEGVSRERVAPGGRSLLHTGRLYSYRRRLLLLLQGLGCAPG